MAEGTSDAAPTLRSDELLRGINKVRGQLGWLCVDLAHHSAGPAAERAERSGPASAGSASPAGSCLVLGSRRAVSMSTWKGDRTTGLSAAKASAGGSGRGGSPGRGGGSGSGGSGGSG